MEIWERNLPLVLVDQEMISFEADFVGSDDQAGARAAAEYSLSLGHRQLPGYSRGSAGNDEKVNPCRHFAPVF